MFIDNPAGHDSCIPLSTFTCFAGMAKAEEFSYELVFEDEDSKRNLESTVALKLVRQLRDKHTGLVVLVFNIVYAPFKTMG